MQVFHGGVPQLTEISAKLLQKPKYVIPAVILGGNLFLSI